VELHGGILRLRSGPSGVAVDRILRYSSLPPEVLEKLRTEGHQELKSLAARHGLPVWDQAWLEAFTGLKPKPLPEGWQNWPDLRTSGFSAKYPGKPIRIRSQWSGADDPVEQG
jgi:hypothetical protein